MSTEMTDLSFVGIHVAPCLFAHIILLIYHILLDKAPLIAIPFTFVPIADTYNENVLYFLEKIEFIKDVFVSKNRILCNISLCQVYWYSSVLDISEVKNIH